MANSANGVIPNQAFLNELVAVNDNPLSRLVRANQPTYLPFWDETAAAVMVDREAVVLDEVEGTVSQSDFGKNKGLLIWR